MSEGGADEEVTDLEQLLDRIEEAAEEDGESVSLEEILKFVGRRSFGPVLLLAGIVTVAPIVGDIPGVPTVIGLFVLLVGVQLLFGRDHFWLPQWMLRRSMANDKLCKAIGWMRRPAAFIDRFLKPRLPMFTEGPMVHVIALVCVGIAVAMPLMEVVPFTANFAGAALTAFGLSLIAHDGLLALLAFAFTGATATFIVFNLP